MCRPCGPRFGQQKTGNTQRLYDIWLWDKDMDIHVHIGKHEADERGKRLDIERTKHFLAAPSDASAGFKKATLEASVP